MRCGTHKPSKETKASNGDRFEWDVSRKHDKDPSEDWEDAASAAKKMIAAECESAKSVAVVVDPRAVISGLRRAAEVHGDEFGSLQHFLAQKGTSKSTPPRRGISTTSPMHYKIEGKPQHGRRGSTYADDACAALNSSIASTIANSSGEMLAEGTLLDLLALTRELQDLIAAAAQSTPRKSGRKSREVRWACSDSQLWCNAASSIGSIVENAIACNATKIDGDRLLATTRVLLTGTFASCPETREASVGAMGRMAPCWCCANAPYEAGVELFNMEESIIRRCTELLGDAAWRVRSRATLALKSWGQWVTGSGTAIFDAVPALVSAMMKRRVNPLAGCKALAFMGCDGLRVLTCILRADDTELPQAMEFGAFDFCSRVLPDSRLRSAAARGIGGINPLAKDLGSGMLRTVQTLLVGCDDPIAIVRSSCIAALAKLSRGSREKVPYLRIRCLHPRIYRSMSDPDEVVRMVAAESLAKAGPEGELLLVEAVQRDSFPLVRAAAIHGLMRVGNSTLRSIVGALDDPAPSVRDAASAALLKIPRAGLVSAIKHMPKHEIIITLKALAVPHTFDTNVSKLLEWLILQLERRRR